MQNAEQEKVLNEWLRDHSGLVIKIVRSFAKSSQDQEDLFQEIAFQAWTSIPRYDRQVAVSTWLYRVSLYTAINWSRRETKWTKRTRCEPVETAIWSPESERDARLEWLYQQIAELPPVDRSLAVMLLEGTSYKEMSQVMGMSESNVGVRIHRLKKHLSEQLEREKQHEF